MESIMQWAAYSAVILAWDHSLIWKNWGPMMSSPRVHTSPAAYTSLTLVSMRSFTHRPPSSAVLKAPAGSHDVFGVTPMQDTITSAPILSPSEATA